jgi:CheY-like chemotaxis protein
LTSAEAGTRPLAALVVDSSAPARLLVGAALIEAGRRRGRAVHVTEAADGFEAIAQFPRGLFDLVVTALPLPTLTGLDLVRLLRARPEPGGVTIVALSGEGGEDETAALEAGATLCLGTPVDADALEKLLSGAGFFGGGGGC